jgi:adenosylmethionine-8-amino-7-oxononanoate aminotransferase
MGKGRSPCGAVGPRGDLYGHKRAALTSTGSRRCGSRPTGTGTRPWTGRSGVNWDAWPTPRSLVSPTNRRLSWERRLWTSLPPGLNRVFYSDNGATSVEVALKMAFQFWAHRGEHRPEYLALAGSYHGDTLGAVSVGGIAAFHKTFRPLLFKSHFAPAPHCYRCPFRKKPPQPEIRTGDEPAPFRAPRPGDYRAQTGCRWECLGGAEKIIKATKSRLAAAIVEPIIQGASGMRVMPRGYLKGFERLCRTNGILLIADEVATGFGRTGRMFAVEHEGVRPDFLCVAKALTGGYLPLAATLTTQKIYKTFLGRYEDFKTFFHGHSYTANPLAVNPEFSWARGPRRKRRVFLRTKKCRS